MVNTGGYSRRVFGKKTPSTSVKRVWSDINGLGRGLSVPYSRS
jgi:hypothetical protein